MLVFLQKRVLTKHLIGTAVTMFEFMSGFTRSNKYPDEHFKTSKGGSSYLRENRQVQNICSVYLHVFREHVDEEHALTVLYYVRLIMAASRVTGDGRWAATFQQKRFIID